MWQFFTLSEFRVLELSHLQKPSQGFNVTVPEFSIYIFLERIWSPLVFALRFAFYIGINTYLKLKQFLNFQIYHQKKCNDVNR